MGTDFCNLPIRQRATIHNLQKTKADIQEKNKHTQPHQKVGEGYEQTLSQKKTFMQLTNT